MTKGQQHPVCWAAWQMGREGARCDTSYQTDKAVERMVGHALDGLVEAVGHQRWAADDYTRAIRALASACHAMIGRDPKEELRHLSIARSAIEASMKDAEREAKEASNGR